VLDSDGRMSVTWWPFETYYDYWGTYTAPAIEPHGGPITLHLEGGNYVPTDFDGDGRFERCGRDLLLFDLFLGSSAMSQGPETKNCGYRFSPI
jgi:hypothetical protein